MSHPAKKPKVEKPFTTPGECEDEVVFTFPDDDRKLYVSKNLVSMASTVFKAMLSKQWFSNESQTVHLDEKKYDDMLELLEHIHPRLQKPITCSNVYVFIPLVQEYMMDGSEPKCAKKLQMLAKQHYERGDAESVEKMLELLNVAVKYDYSNVIESVLTMTSKWEVRDFWEDWEDTLIEEYERLPDNIRIRLLEGRLKFKNKGRIF